MIVRRKSEVRNGFLGFAPLLTEAGIDLDIVEEHSISSLSAGGGNLRSVSVDIRSVLSIVQKSDKKGK